MENNIRLIKILTIAEKYEKRKEWNNPVYVRQGTILLENGQTMNYCFKSTKAKNVKKWHNDMPITGVFYCPASNSFSHSYGSNIMN